jgi:hypothetical protein
VFILLKNMRKAPRRYRFLWTLPLLWLAIAGLGWIYRGGEYITFGMVLLPGLLLAWAGKMIGIASNNHFGWITAAGLIPMFLAGLLLDYARVRWKIFVLSFCVGIVIAYALIGIPFLSEARRLGSISAAAHHFDFDQRERAIAWQVLGTALGLYLSIPTAILVTVGMNLSRPAADAEKLRGLSEKAQPSLEGGSSDD